MRIINIIWLKVIDLMDGSFFLSSINKFLDFIVKVSRSSKIVSFFNTMPSDELVENNIITKAIKKFFGFFTFIGEKFFAIAWENSFFGKTLGKIHIGSWLTGSLFFKLISRLFGLSFESIGICEIGVIAIIFLAPFVPTMALAGVVICVTFLFILKLLITKHFFITVDLTGVFITLFAIETIFFGITSFTPSSSIKIAVLTSIFMLFYLLIIMMINTKEKFELMLFVFCTSALLVGLYGLYQQFSGFTDTTWTDKTLFQGLKLRVYSVFDNPNVYGEYLLLALPICFSMVFYTKKYVSKLYFSIIFLVLMANLGLTYSRGCYIALLGAILIGVLFMEKRLIVFFSLGILALPFILPPTIIARILSITNIQDSSTSFRIMIWQSTILALKDFWYIGVGQGSDAFNVVYPMYSFSLVPAPHAHSVYLQTFIETGIVGLFTLISIALCFFKTQISYFYKSTDFKIKIVIVSFICGVLAFLIQGFFDYVFYNYKVYLLFFITLAMGNSFVLMNKKGVENESN